MKKHNDQPIQDVLKELVNQKHMKKGVWEARIKEIWANDIGKLVNNKTEKIWFDKGTVYIKLTSAPLRNQMMIGKQKMKENFNAALDSDVVKAIRIM